VTKMQDYPTREEALRAAGDGSASVASISNRGWSRLRLPHP
jgi:hypothetical protein